MLVASFIAAWFRHWSLAELVVSASWGVAVLGAFAGWGVVVARLCWPDRDVGLALRTVWGASLLAFFGGTLAMVSQVGRVWLIVFVAVGILIQIATWMGQRAALDERWRRHRRAMRMNIAMTCVGLFALSGVLVHYFGGAADFTSNPYDDDVAYHLFTKQLVERGSLIDPFSFRRMSTLGGQSFFHALLYVRVPIFHMNLFDRGMCVLLSAALVVEARVQGVRPPAIAQVTAVVFLVALPFTGINTASYYSGVVWFLALYLTLERMDDEPSRTLAQAARRVAPLALVGAAACTLRQNYQSQVGLFIVISYGVAIARAKARRDWWRELGVSIALLGAFTLPWLVLSYRSNQTFLFPLMKGTLRAGVRVQSSTMTPSKLVRFFTDVWLTPEPIHALPFFALAGLALRDPSRRRALASQWLAGVVSIVFLCVGFSMADAGNLARYDYGFITASVLLTWLAVTTRATGGMARDLVPAVLATIALVYTLEANTPRTKKMLDGRVRDTAELLRRSVPPQEEPPIAAAYHALQNAVPSGAPIVVLLDQPIYLDYARNYLVNLDMPGMASLAPGIPCFQGPEPVADYFASLGLRYVAFVEQEHSTFLYRRDVWFENLYHPDQFWRVIAPYLLDVMDNLAALAQTRVHLHDEAGMVMLDLQTKR